MSDEFGNSLAKIVTTQVVIIPIQWLIKNNEVIVPPAVTQQFPALTSS